MATKKRAISISLQAGVDGGYSDAASGGAKAVGGKAAAASSSSSASSAAGGGGGDPSVHMEERNAWLNLVRVADAAMKRRRRARRARGRDLSSEQNAWPNLVGRALRDATKARR